MTADQNAELRSDLEDLQARMPSVQAPKLDRFSQFAVEHLSDATYWMEEDASIIYVNEAASRLMGYSVEELLALKVYELNVDLDAERWPAIWGLLKAEGRRTFEARHRRKDGQVIEVEITAHFLEFEGREYSCAFVRDIGARKELEQRLRHAEKMEAIGRLAGGVAHDFNNQLAVILGCAEVLRLELSDRPEVLHLVDEMARIVRVSADLTSQLLAFSRRGKFLVEPVDLHGLVREVVSMLSRSIDKRIRIDTLLDAEHSWVLGDPSQLQNAVLNIALNARDAMPEGGTLVLCTHNVDGDARPAPDQPADLAPGPHIVLSVRDTGVGMDADMRDRVFEPFFTTKSPGSGTGLGLAAVYGTVRNHRGAITVDSKRGQGTTFRVYLPITHPGSRATPRADEPVGLRLRGHVLLVDDEAPLRDVGTRMLEALGCCVTAVADGRGALQILQEPSSTVDLVLLDLMMPGISGRELFERLRSTAPHVPVLIMSGYSLDGEVQAMIEAGARGFLQKPFAMADLAGKVGAALRR